MPKKNLVLLLLCSALAIVLIGWNQIFELRFEEPRRAIVAWEMAKTGNWVQPQIHGWAYYNKPPFFNWVLLGFANVSGSFSEWWLRLPSSLSLLGIIPLFYVVARRYLSRLSAWFIGIFTVTSVEIFFHASVYAGEIDLFFLWLTCCQILSIFIFFRRKQWLLLFGVSYVLAACGVLTKGLPSMAFQALTLLAWFVVQGEWKRLFYWQHFVGISLFFALLAGYFYSYAQQADAVAFVANLFTEASSRTALEKPWWDSALNFATFPLYVLQLLLPWSVLLPFIFRKGTWHSIRQNEFLWFSFVFIAANLPLYWLSPGVRARYLFMFFPFMYGILAHAIAINSSHMPKLSRIYAGIWQGLLVLVGFAVLALPFLSFTGEVSAIWLRVFLLLALLTAVGISYRKSRQQANSLLWVAALLLVARLGFNLVFLPAQSEKSTSMIYRRLSSEILEITQKAPIHFHEEIEVVQGTLRLGPVVLGEYSLRRPPFFHYQLPYYLSRANNHVMQYDPQIRPGIFYILPNAVAEARQLKVYKTFYANHKRDFLWALAKKE